MKKVFNYVLLVIGLFFITSPVLAMNIASCETLIPGAIIDAKIPNTISTIVNIIKIAVPVLLVLFGCLDLVKGIIAAKEDEIKKGQQTFIKRLIAGALVFFVFVVVQFILSLVANDEKGNIMTCANCFLNGDCTYKIPASGCPEGYKASSTGDSCVKN